VAADGSGNVSVADTSNNTLRKVTPAGVVSTLAGMARASGSADGTGPAARFYEPSGVAVDGSGNVYVADKENATIRKITPAGVVSTIAGTAGSGGSEDGRGPAARFVKPTRVAVDGNGNVYVVDTYGQTLRKVTPAGMVSTLAGMAGEPGSADGTGPGARFYYPHGVAVDGTGNVYVADTWNNTIRKVTPAGVVSTLAGMAGDNGSADGTGAAARFLWPSGLAVDGTGNVYVADTWNHTLRKITPAGVVSTLAGMALASGSEDGTGPAARFYYPEGVAVDGSGNVYVADTQNHTIRKVSPAGVVSTPIGVPGLVGNLLGPLPASLVWPVGVAVDATNHIFIVLADAVLEVKP
jgi:sugar lactone lactonase YvrE